MRITAYGPAGTAKDHATPSRAHARPCTHVSTAVIITTVASKTSTARVFRDGEGLLRTCIRTPPVRPNASNATFEQLRTPQTPAIALAYSNLAIMLQQQRTFLPTHPNRPRSEAPTRRQYLQAPPSSTQGIFAPPTVTPVHLRLLALLERVLDVLQLVVVVARPRRRRRARREQRHGPLRQEPDLGCEGVGAVSTCYRRGRTQGRGGRLTGIDGAPAHRRRGPRHV